MRLHEIDDITPFDDDDIETARSIGFWKMEQQSRGKKLFTTIGNISIYVERWPLVDKFSKFFFVNGNNAVGHATLIKRTNFKLPIQTVVWTVSPIYLKRSERGSGFGKSFYTSLLDHGLVLASDDAQTIQSKKTWTYLASKYRVYLYNTDIDNYSSQNITDINIAYGKNRNHMVLIVIPNN